MKQFVIILSMQLIKGILDQLSQYLDKEMNKKMILGMKLVINKKRFEYINFLINQEYGIRNLSLMQAIKLMKIQLLVIEQT